MIKFQRNFIKQVVDNKQMNYLNTKPDISYVIKVAFVEQGIPKLSYFDPFDDHGTNVQEKYSLLFVKAQYSSKVVYRH
jgi:hypothetical protein